MASLGDLHRVGAALVAILIVCVALAVVVGRIRGNHRLAIDRLILGVLGAAVITAVVGLAEVPGGRTPRDNLHLLYGVALFATLPIARFAWPALRPPGRAWLLLAGCAVSGGLLLRLLQTG